MLFFLISHKEREIEQSKRIRKEKVKWKISFFNLFITSTVAFSVFAQGVSICTLDFIYIENQDMYEAYMHGGFVYNN